MKNTRGLVPKVLLLCAGKSLNDGGGSDTGGNRGGVGTFG